MAERSFPFWEKTGDYRHHNAAEPQQKTESQIAKIAITAKIAIIEKQRRIVKSTEEICEKKHDFKALGSIDGILGVRLHLSSGHLDNKAAQLFWNQQVG